MIVSRSGILMKFIIKRDCKTAPTDGLSAPSVVRH